MATIRESDSASQQALHAGEIEDHEVTDLLFTLIDFLDLQALRAGHRFEIRRREATDAV